MPGQLWLLVTSALRSRRLRSIRFLSGQYGGRKCRYGQSSTVGPTDPVVLLTRKRASVASANAPSWTPDCMSWTTGAALGFRKLSALKEAAAAAPTWSPRSA
jgi:hypothetical protein